MFCWMHSVDFRKAALMLYGYFRSMRKVSRILKVSIASISRWCKRIDPLPHSNKPRKFSEECRLTVKSMLLNDPLLSCQEIVAKIAETCNVEVSKQLISVVIRKLGFTYKRCKIRTSTSMPTQDVKTAFLKRVHDASNVVVVSVDESGFNNRPFKLYGYASKGHEVVLRAPACADSARYSLLMAIGSDGRKHRVVNKGSTNTEVFANFIRGCPFPRKTALLLDNASIHRTAIVRAAAEDKGYTLLFLPPYSPELNPIEMAFAKIKRGFRKDRYRSGFRLVDSIERNVECISSSDIHGFFGTIAKSCT